MRDNKMKLCADDWGFSPGINDGILDLASRGYLYSVSLAGNTEYLKHGLSDLLKLKANIKFNIHFNLTYKSPINIKNETLYNLNTQDFYPFPVFAMKAILHNISKAEIKNEFEEQIKILKELNIPISGVDGHQHIHILPLVYNEIKSLFRKYEIRSLRYMNDKDHLYSYLQGLYCKNFLLDKTDQSLALPCGYILEKNLVNNEALVKKLGEFDRLIVHPAKYNDFEASNMTDKLKDKRIVEYKKLIGLSN
jgi:predicted glycoside hydrolase/deacetylase ChbG (UPF0249 family)